MRSHALFPRQAGLGLATALFVITVLAFLAVAINQLVRSSAKSSGEQTQLIRAFYAAESGVQFGLNAVFPPDGSASSCPALVTFPAFDVDGLNACAATVMCGQLDVANAGTFFTITSTGDCGGVSRTIQVRAE